MIPALLLAAGASTALRAPFSHAKVIGFTPDGKAALFDASIDAPIENEQLLWGEHVWVSIGDDGRPQHVARYVESRADDVRENQVHLTPEAQQLWEGAEDEEQGRRLRDAVKGKAAPYLERSTGEMKGAGTARARVEQAGSKTCPSLRLFVSIGAREALAFEDPCPEEPATTTGTSLTWAWNPQGAALALAWAVGRGDVAHAHLGVLTARNVGALDLLVAGGDAATAQERLAVAGFRVAHEGAAVKRREQTAVYFAPGFEAEAAEVAQALGGPASAVQALAWKTPYPVTVALGAR